MLRPARPHISPHHYIPRWLSSQHTFEKMTARPRCVVTSIGLPIVALIGAGIVMNKPMLGGIVMIVSAIGVFWLLGGHGFSLYLAAPLLIAGGLGVLGGREKAEPGQP